MGFRRSTNEEPGSSRWRTRHRKALLSCGLPESVVESDKVLTYVLLHGADELGTGWDPTWLDDDQARALYRLLSEEIGGAAGFEILPALEKRLRHYARDAASVPSKRGKILFYSVGDAYGELSNFAPYPIRLDRTQWPTSEHYFQAQKFLDPAIREQVRRANNPDEAARIGRDRRLRLRPDWHSARVEVMRKAVRAKFEQHPNLASLLLATGDAELVEHTERDAFWGDGGGSGQNMLGRILMEVREILKGARAR